MTKEQLRKNSPPNAWEAAWVMWRYQDDWHHYYFVLKPNGIELGKKQNDIQSEEQVFLFTVKEPLYLTFLYRHQVAQFEMSYGNRGGGYGGGGRGFGGGGPKPVEEGKEYDVQITEISRQGDGIARIQGFVIFVKGAKSGESAKVKILSVGPRFATAQKV